MSREVRRVPATWTHPKDRDGHLIPLLGRSFETALREWEAGLALWLTGQRDVYRGGQTPHGARCTEESWIDWDGARPEPDDYMPEWPEAERTHYQMYETTSEGTPISPVMDSPEALARWLADTGASAFARMTATYEQWLAMCREGYSYGSAAIENGVVTSGVASVSKGKTYE